MYPHERSLARNLADKPFAIIGVNSDKDLDALRVKCVEKNITWRSFQNEQANGSISKDWNVTGWPTTYLIDKDGVIRFKNVRGEALDSALSVLLTEMGEEVALGDIDHEAEDKIEMAKLKEDAAKDAAEDEKEAEAKDEKEAKPKDAVKAAAKEEDKKDAAADKAEDKPAEEKSAVKKTPAKEEAATEEPAKADKAKADDTKADKPKAAEPAADAKDVESKADKPDVDKSKAKETPKEKESKPAADKAAK